MNALGRIGLLYYRVPLEDLDDAVQFIGTSLGLELKFRDGTDWVAFDAGGLTLALEGAPIAHAEGPFLSFRSDDIEAAHSAVVESGGAASEITVGGHERRFSIASPLGNPVSVYQPGAGK